MRRWLPALAAALLGAACAVPVFDPAMSTAVKAFRASHVIGTSNPTIGPDLDSNGKPDWDLKRETITFMPERWDGSIDPGNGFVIRREEDSSWNQVWYQWWDGSKVKWMATPAGYDREEGLCWRWPVSLKGGPYLGAIIFDWSDLDTWVNRLYANTGSQTCDWFGPFDPGAKIDADLAAITGEPVILGLSMNPLISPNPDDRVHALVRSGTAFAEAHAEVNGATVSLTFIESISPYPYILNIPTTARHMNYARDDTELRSYAQLMENDTWHTWVWRGTIGTGPSEFDEPAGIEHRIDAVLATNPTWGWPVGSYLFSTEKQIGRIYRYNGLGTGSQVAEFGLGTLQFLGQMYLAGSNEWELVFSRTLVDRTADPPQVHFEVRGIITKDLLAEFGL